MLSQGRQETLQLFEETSLIRIAAATSELERLRDVAAGHERTFVQVGDGPGNSLDPVMSPG